VERDPNRDIIRHHVSLEINGEVGRTFAENARAAGSSPCRPKAHVLPRLELLAELHGERVTDSTGLIAVGGARLKLTSKMILLIASGHSVRSLPENGSRTYAYAGVQLNLPRQFTFEREVGRRPRRR